MSSRRYGSVAAVRPVLAAVLLMTQVTASRAVDEAAVVDYTIIVTGSELLTGVYADGHTYFLTRTLRPLGLHCVGSMSVDDRAEDIRQALQFARGRSKLVIVTGGLGPTDSDITRDVISEFTRIPLREHPAVLEGMEKRFRTRRDRLRSNLRRQARVPTRGTYLKNSAGTAVGLVYELDDGAIVALPGPPRELQPMVRDQLVPYLARRFGTRVTGCSLTVRFVGLGQSQIDQTMKDHIQLPANVMQSSQFESGRVDFTFALPGDSKEDHARLERLKAELHKFLGDQIYADDPTTSLEQSVAERLRARHHSVALAEIGTGGSLVAGLSRSEVGRTVLAGAFVAASEQRLREILNLPDVQPSASNDQAAERIANAVATRAQSDWVVVIGQPGRGGNSFVNVLFKHPDGQFSRARLRWPGTSRSAQMRLETQVLDQLRLKMTTEKSANRP